jgi:peptidylprolyl isomerase
MPGMQINIDNTIGIVKTVSGGRTLVDFNHPLAGKDLFYKVKINKKITDDKEKLSSYIKLSLGIKDFNLEINENNAKIGLKIEIPKEAEEKLREKITGLIPSIKKVELSFVKEEAKKS